MRPQQAAVDQPAKAKRTEDRGDKPKMGCQVFCHPAQPLHCAVKEMESWKKKHRLWEKEAGSFVVWKSKESSLLIP